MITTNKYLFRFIVSFFTILILPFPISWDTYTEKIHKYYTDVFHVVIPWFAKHILRLEKDITIFPNGSGDTSYNFVLLVWVLLMAIMVTIIWSILDKKDRNYEKCNYWFLAYLRYYVGISMISYGFVKIVPLQFWEPSFSRLISMYGDFSPMGLAWSFIGFSPGYSMLIGWSEFTGGLLLLFRKTKKIGAIFLLFVIGNVVAINMFYDVCVKLFSITLWIATIVILVPDLPNLWRYFILNKPVSPDAYYEPFSTKKARKIKSFSKYFLIIGFLSYSVYYTYNTYYEYGPGAEKPVIYGLYEMQHRIINKDTIPIQYKDTANYQYLAIEYKGYARTKSYNQVFTPYSLKVDTLEHTLRLTHLKDSTKLYDFTYKKTDSTLFLHSIKDQDTIEWHMKRKFKKDFRLMKRGFRWVNEYPYNK